MNQLRYRTRYAIHRDVCRGCYSNIENGKVLLAVMVQVMILRLNEIVVGLTKKHQFTVSERRRERSIQLSREMFL